MESSRSWFLWLVALGIIGGLVASIPADGQNAIVALKAVGADGKGHREAVRAWQTLSKSDAAALLPILRAFDDANPLAANWLRSAVETIADREIAAGRPLPAAELESFVLDVARDTRARRLAFEQLTRVDSGAADRLIPGMLHDPGAEFRRDAVSRRLDEANALFDGGNKEKALEIYRQALGGAVDDDQVKPVVARLRELGERVDLPKHFGFLTTWQAIGPFDNRGLVGFQKEYPPERDGDLKQTYAGQLGDVAWQPVNVQDDYGIVDIAKTFQNYKGSVMYFTTEFHSPASRDVDVRLGTPNAWKLWVNGQHLFGRDEYHHGTMIDQYKVRVHLEPGKNVILLKICQNEQKQDWAQDYHFQLRICDAAGAGVLSNGPAATGESKD